jgi:hypothetical protein
MCSGVALRTAKRLQCGFRIARNYYLYRWQARFAQVALRFAQRSGYNAAFVSPGIIILIAGK